MIDGQLEIGVPMSNTFTEDDDQGIYELALTAGQAVDITLESDESLYMKLYGPDGFMVAEYDPYTDDGLSYTAESDGTYLVEVEGFWESSFTLTVSAAE
jgi:hypothetical protein